MVKQFLLLINFYDYGNYGYSISIVIEEISSDFQFLGILNFYCHQIIIVS